MSRAMRPVRTIFCIVLLVATTWSLAAAYPAAMPVAAVAAADGHGVAEKDAHACCHKTAPARSPSNDPKTSGCPTKCMMMQCCRMLPTRAEPRPALLLSGDAVVEVQILPPVRLLSLAEPADIFHPPRA